MHKGRKTPRRLAAVAGTAAVVGALLVPATGTAYAASPDVVVSQVFGGGGNSGAPYQNDFVELYNRGSSTVSLSGWTVQYASSSGNTWASTPLTGSIAPGHHYLVQEAAGAGSGAALPAPDATGDEAVITELRSFTGSSMDRLSLFESTLPSSARDVLVTAGARLVDIDRQASERCPTCEGTPASIPTNLLTGGVLTTGVTTVLVTASQNPGLLQPVKTSPPKPEPISGQDVDGVEVPDLEVPDPTASPTASPTATQTSQPMRGTSRIHAPSIQKAMFRSHPAQSPLAPEATRWRLPSVGLAGGAVRVRSRTESCTMASSRRRASAALCSRNFVMMRRASRSA